MFFLQFPGGMDYIFIRIHSEPTCSLYGVNDDFPRYYHILKRVRSLDGSSNVGFTDTVGFVLDLAAKTGNPVTRQGITLP